MPQAEIKPVPSKACWRLNTDQELKLLPSWGLLRTRDQRLRGTPRLEVVPQLWKLEEGGPVMCRGRGWVGHPPDEDRKGRLCPRVSVHTPATPREDIAGSEMELVCLGSHSQEVATEGLTAPKTLGFHLHTVSADRNSLGTQLPGAGCSLREGQQLSRAWPGNSFSHPLRTRWGLAYQ